ncbi:hypothetical protein AB478_08105 [Staphylococcus aureus]|nr:hypothetical protein SA40TW_07815 [Staphylococcus aureus]ATN50006.1 hypothetical protein AB478_08105 [Staphylococcus aureus]
MTERKCTCNKLFSILVRGPNTENFEKKFYRQCKLGRGPNIEAGEKSAYNNVQVGGAPTQRNWIPNFYRQCKLGWDDDKEILFL